jgi:RNA polymerase sigma factor (sigma-70 family)
MSGESLSETPTCWTTITSAHTPGPSRQKAMSDLVSRYHDAIERYLRLKLRDRHLADEVFQEFMTKLVENKLAAAEKSKGRFRDYVRTILRRIIIDHFRIRKLQPLPPCDLPDPSSPDEGFDHVWREVVIKRVLARLETYEVSTAKNRYATVLNLRLEQPDASIEQLTELLTVKIGTRVTTEAFRKTLERARAKFLELMIKELKETIHPAQPDDIEAEIYDLGLGHWYRRYGGKIKH